MDLFRIAARIASNDVCVYVDLDETLIHTMRLDVPQNLKKFDGWEGDKIELSDSGRPYDGRMGTLLRPGAREMLNELHSIGPVYLLTYSINKYASEIVRELELGVNEIFSREDLAGKVGKGQTKFVLIDDLNTLDPMIQTKLKAAGVEESDSFVEQQAWFERHHLQVQGFSGSDGDTGLNGIPSRVRMMLEDQNSTSP